MNGHADTRRLRASIRFQTLVLWSISLRQSARKLADVLHLGNGTAERIVACLVVSTGVFLLSIAALKLLGLLTGVAMGLAIALLMLGVLAGALLIAWDSDEELAEAKQSRKELVASLRQSLVLAEDAERAITVLEAHKRPPPVAPRLPILDVVPVREKVDAAPTKSVPLSPSSAMSVVRFLLIAIARLMLIGGVLVAFAWAFMVAPCAASCVGVLVAGGTLSYLSNPLCPQCKCRGPMPWRHANMDGSPDRRYKHNSRHCPRCGWQPGIRE